MQNSTPLLQVQLMAAATRQLDIDMCTSTQIALMWGNVWYVIGLPRSCAQGIKVSGCRLGGAATVGRSPVPVIIRKYLFSFVVFLFGFGFGRQQLPFGDRRSRRC